MFSLCTNLVFFFSLILSDFVEGNEINIERERSYPTPVKDSPLLEDLVESLSKQKNSPVTSSEIYEEYDYIIVGAGTAGSVVASRLSEVPCVSVLLLEAGPNPPKLNDIVAYARSFWFTNLDWQYETTPQRHTGKGLINRQLKWPSGKGLGGCTLLNGGIHIRGNKKDYDDWAAMGAKGWSYKEVLPYFIRLEDNKIFEEVENGYHGVGGPITVELPRYNAEIKSPLYQAATAMGYRIVDPNSIRQTGFNNLESSLRQGQSCTTAKAYLVPVENRTNLDILPHAFVKKVIIKRKRAVGVIFDYDGQTYRVFANREVILSAGALKTPHLLMLSGIGPKEQLHKFKIPVHADLPVGKNLQDHGGITLNFELKPFIQKFSDKLSNEQYIKQYIFDRSGPLGSVEGSQYAAFLLNNEINPDIDFPNYELYFGEGSLSTAEKYWNLTPEVYKQVFGPYVNRSIMSCYVQMVHPRSRGSIQLQSANPYANLSIDPNYLADPRDVEDLVQGMKTCKRICSMPEMQQVILEPFQTLYPGCEEYSRNEDAYFRCVLRTVLITAGHYCCTAKMGDFNDRTTVLDPQLRVKYIKSLRVADASIMPKIITGNTGVPAIMIGEKAADLIKDSIVCD